MIRWHYYRTLGVVQTTSTFKLNKCRVLTFARLYRLCTTLAGCHCNIARCRRAPLQPPPASLCFGMLDPQWIHHQGP